MSLFTMADLHLSSGSAKNKSMAVFGNRWQDYEEKIKNNWEKIITDEDTIVIPGDISWATSLEEAKGDLTFLESLPGKKIIGKGNHDFWWSTASKMTAFFESSGFKTISTLYNNATDCEDFVIAGTRGWFYDNENPNMPQNADYDKLISREAGRLKMSLDMAKELSKGEKEIIVFLHFPPIWNGADVAQISDMLSEYKIRRCYFGHIHGNYTAPPCFEEKGVEYILISSDYLNFVPRLII